MRHAVIAVDGGILDGLFTLREDAQSSATATGAGGGYRRPAWFCVQCPAERSVHALGASQKNVRLTMRYRAIMRMSAASTRSHIYTTSWLQERAEPGLEQIGDERRGWEMDRGHRGRARDAREEIRLKHVERLCMPYPR